MGLFWDYFHRRLRWPLIHHRRGPLSALVEGASVPLDEAREAVLWLRRQFAPETCDAAYVAAHGRSRGLRRHRYETEEQYRTRVVRAYAWALLGGKQAGLPELFRYMGYDTEIQSLRDEDPERWAEFRVILRAGEVFGAEEYGFLEWLVREYKPARSLWSVFRLDMGELPLDRVWGAVPRLGTRTTYMQDLSVRTDPLARHWGGVPRLGTRSTYMQDLSVQVPATVRYFGGVQRIGARTVYTTATT